MRWFEWSARQLQAPFGVTQNPLLSNLLWLGLAVFTVALLILTRTRWGQAKPISKCVVLSVFAHILLAIYAYSTSLLPNSPVIPDETVFKLKIITAELDPQPPQAITTSTEPVVQAPHSTTKPATLPDREQPLVRSESVADQPASPEPSNVHAPTLVNEIKQDTVDAPPLDQAPASNAEPDLLEEITEKTPPPDPVAAAPPAITSPTPPDSETQRSLPPTDPTPTPNLVTTPPDQNPVPPDQSPVPPDQSPVPPDQSPVPPDQNLVAVDRNLPTTSPLTLAQTATRPEPAPNPPDPQSSVDREVVPPAPTESITRSIRETPVADTGVMPSRTTRSRYAQRAPERRPAIVLSGGGGEHTERAVASALHWLVANQEPDGHWDAARFGGGREAPMADRQRNRAGANADSGITGLALLALLGSGQTHLQGESRQSIQFGLEYLLRQQTADGNLGGNAGLYAQMYCHGIALLALGEACVASDDQRLQPYLQRGVRFTLNAQHPTTGGWRYQPGDRGDTSQFGWQVMSLRTAQLAGIEVPARARTGMLRFLQSVSSTRQPGLASYRRGERSTPSMTAEALVCRFFLQVPRNTTIETGAVELLRRSLPTANPVNYYYWYYGSLGLFQLGGEPWKTWNGALLQTLLPRQRTEGPEAGSWDPDSVWGNYGGRVYTTALATLCLQTYYRYPQMAPRTALQTPWTQIR
ncbi:MAG: hypothetical protein VX346_12860 [Planctomycetota bacterium]|nr:hypothetical protein [Planctomycetota bacterium]